MLNCLSGCVCGIYIRVYNLENALVVVYEVNT